MREKKWSVAIAYTVIVVGMIVAVCMLAGCCAPTAHVRSSTGVSESSASEEPDRVDLHNIGGL